MYTLKNYLILYLEIEKYLHIYISGKLSTTVNHKINGWYSL